LGGLVGLIMFVIDIAVKRTNILWMPISAIVLGVTSMLLSILAF
jgi:membrane protein implicated in regulation of membrane protease activity